MHNLSTPKRRSLAFFLVVGVTRNILSFQVDDFPDLEATTDKYLLRCVI
jgi:hypothetical protein